MFRISAHATFSAAHALLIRGEREALHGHDWRVTATVEGPTLDADGLLIDFHALERALGEVTAPFRNANLNDTPPFDRLNPSAENVARHLGDALVHRLTHVAPVTVARVACVSVTEAPGCEATYAPPAPPAR